MTDVYTLPSPHADLSAESKSNVSCNPALDDDEPSDLDLQHCRTVPDALSGGTWLVAVVAGCEKFAYYGFVIVLQDYIQYRRADTLHPGALGLGENTASLIVNLVTLLTYVTPIPAALIADQYLGRYKTLLLTFSVYALALTTLTITSIPALLDRGSGLPGLIVFVLIVCMGVGGVRSALPPFLAEQCKEFKPRVETKKSGERVIVTHEETIEYAFNVYYWACNIGSQSMVTSTLLAKYVGYWLSFLVTVVAILCALLILLVNRKTFGHRESSPSISWTCRILSIAARNRFHLEAAKPSNLACSGDITVPWTEDFIDRLRFAFKSCGVGIPFIFYWLCQNQLVSNTISQAGMMQTYGVPNDLLPDINAITVVIMLPVITHFVNPALRRHGLPLTPITRIAIGFLFEAFAMGYASGVQGLIYASPPCYSRPLACPASKGGTIPNQVNFAVQLPVYIFEGVGEVFSNPAISEYAYIVAPGTMKSVLQAVVALTAGAGSGLGIALSPTYYNPALLAVYASLAGVMVLCSAGTFLFLQKDAKRHSPIAEADHEIDGGQGTE